MLINAGYITRNGPMAIDANGRECPIIECTIYKIKFGISIDNIGEVISQNNAAPIKMVRHHYAPHLETTVGYAVLSKKGKAVNLFIEKWGCFTVSLSSLRSVLSRRKRFARVAEISDGPRHPSPQQNWHGQQHIITNA